ncbi:hypothetical protein VTL71DRAFT_12424 [Oculimacula yallundae]|uniref:Uncharacterized protein n=1 Tax=Oculimacula yallundae TaxID=86028 RepID=A0ABR4CMZ8_9HELO
MTDIRDGTWQAANGQVMGRTKAFAIKCPNYFDSSLANDTAENRNSISLNLTLFSWTHEEWKKHVETRRNARTYTHNRMMQQVKERCSFQASYVCIVGLDLAMPKFLQLPQPLGTAAAS